MLLRRVTLVALVLTAIASAAAPTAALVSKLKKDLASASKTSLSVIAAERQIALAQLKPMVDLAKTTVLVPGNAVGAMSPVIEFQSTMRSRIDDGLSAICSCMMNASQAFHVLEPNAPSLPTGMTFGDGGAGDAAEIAFMKKVDATYAPLRKSIAALAKALRAKSNVALTALVRAPVPESYSGFTDSSFYGSYDAFSIDIALGVSDLGVADDGIVAFGGSADPTGGAVTVYLNGPDFTTDTVTPDPTTGRWLFVYDKAGQGVKEASYSIRARQGNNGAWTNWHIGVQ